jgi:hypothetical protein
MFDKLLRANGTETQVNPTNGTNYTLEELQGFVGGYVEIVRIPYPGMIMVVNEEGHLKGLTHNSISSFIAGQPIVGNALVCATGRVK